MFTTLTLVQYPKIFIPFAFMAMAIFHFPLRLKKKVKFYKLMGTGRNGTFDKIPDLQQWAILTVFDEQFSADKEIPLKKLYGKFITSWFRFFHCELFSIVLEPVKGHGKWDGKEPFSFAQTTFFPGEKVATLTRATIRLTKLKYFWQNVAGAANSMKKADGFIFSAGVGEIPWIKQATFSIWNTEKDMNQFAYGMRVHADIVKKTRKEKWYSEDMFTRFRILKYSGTIKGKNPLEGNL